MGATLFMTKEEEFKQKAIKEYPNGTEFECAYSGVIKTIDVLKRDTYSVYGGDGRREYSVDGGFMNGYICYNNTWARIISKPKDTVMKEPKFKIGDRVKVCSDAEDINRWGYLPEGKAINLGCIERCTGEIDQQKIYDGRYYYRIIPMIGYICEDCLKLEISKPMEKIKEPKFKIGQKVQVCEKTQDKNGWGYLKSNKEYTEKVNGVANNKGKVVELVVYKGRNYYKMEDGNHICEDCLIDIEPVKTRENLIEEAKKRYPVGTVVRSPVMGSLTETIKDTDVFRNDTGNVYIPSKITLYDGMTNKWAEVVTSTTITSLPLKWCVHRKTRSDWDVIEKYVPFKVFHGNGTYYDSQGNCSDRIKSDYTEITLEQFKLWVLGESKIEAKPYDLLADARARYPIGSRAHSVIQSNLSDIVQNPSDFTIDSDGDVRFKNRITVYLKKPDRWGQCIPAIETSRMSWEETDWGKRGPSNKVVGKYPLTFEDIDAVIYAKGHDPYVNTKVTIDAEVCTIKVQKGSSVRLKDTEKEVNLIVKQSKPIKIYGNY